MKSTPDTFDRSRTDAPTEERTPTEQPTFDPAREHEPNAARGGCKAIAGRSRGQLEFRKPVTVLQQTKKFKNHVQSSDADFCNKFRNLLHMN